MKLQDLLADVPEVWRPIVAKYGRAIVGMTAEEFAAWVELLVCGRTQEAWSVVMGRMEDPDMLAAGESLTEKWNEANRGNAARLKLQRDACMAVLKVLLAAVLAGAGL